MSMSAVAAAREFRVSTRDAIPSVGPARPQGGKLLEVAVAARLCSVDRFWSKVDKSGDCWEWVACRDKDGYGRFYIVLHDHVLRRSNRIAWTLVNGPIEDGIHICHTCDNPGCVRPDHLFAGTILVNNRDCLAKGRKPSGERHWTHTKTPLVARGEQQGLAKLNKDAVIDIRSRFERGEKKSAIASFFGLGWSTVDSVIKRETWAHIN